MESIKELRKRNKAFRSCGAYSKENSNYTERQQSDQVISLSPRDGVVERAPGPGLKQQASSFKRQATSNKLQSLKLQAASIKPQATSIKLQAASNKLFYFTTLIKFQAASVEARG